MSDSAARLKLAVLASGAGSTLQNLLDACADGRVPGQVVLVVVSRPGLGAEAKAASAGVEVLTSRDAGAIFAACDARGVQLVCMAGWLVHTPIPPAWENRVMNVHPSLLPSFGGQGMFGRHVHEAVLAHGCRVSGCTVHFVDNHYDAGPIVSQRCVPVEPDDDATSLANRVQAVERELYPAAVRHFAQGRLRVQGRRVVTLPEASTLKA